MIIAPGSDWDIHGCIASAGYTWCDILGKCIRLWNETCEYPSNCLFWNDGCNTCLINNDNLESCSEIYCFAINQPFCLD